MSTEERVAMDAPCLDPSDGSSVGSVITTARLRLRPMVASDLGLYCTLHGDPVVMAEISAVQERAAAERSFAAALACNAATRFRQRFWMARTLEGADVGLFSLDGRADARAAEMGTILQTSAQGLGYTSEAIPALAAHAFSALGLERVIARHRGSHGAVRGVMLRVGFVLLPPAEGADPDVCSWELRREDWERKRQSTPTPRTS